MAQSSFEDRLVRINSGKQMVGEGLRLNKNRLIGAPRSASNLHLHMLVSGALFGGVFGVLFALNIGLLALVGLDADALYQFVLFDWMKGVLIGGVAIAPTGFVLSILSVRRRPGGFIFWMGYLGGVVAANRADIEAYFTAVNAVAVG